MIDREGLMIEQALPLFAKSWRDMMNQIDSQHDVLEEAGQA